MSIIFHSLCIWRKVVIVIGADDQPAWTLKNVYMWKHAKLVSKIIFTFHQSAD